VRPLPGLGAFLLADVPLTGLAAFLLADVDTVCRAEATGEAGAGSRVSSLVSNVGDPLEPYPKRSACSRNDKNSLSGSLKDLRMALRRRAVINSGAAGTVSSGRQGRGEPGVLEPGSLRVSTQEVGTQVSSPSKEPAKPEKPDELDKLLSIIRPCTADGSPQQNAWPLDGSR